MEQSEFETLKPSQTSFNFSSHRRRHLRSETYSTLVRIFSHCYDDSQPSHANHVVPDESARGNGIIESLQATEHQVHDELTGHSLESEFFNQAQMEIDELEHVKRTKGNEGFIYTNGIYPTESLEERNPIGDVALTNNHKDYFDLEEILLDESGNEGQLELDKEHYSCKVNRALDSSLDIDIAAESSVLYKTGEEKISPVERNVVEEVEHEMQQKEMELNESVLSCAVMNSSLCITSDKEVEEGEISGDFGIYDESMDLLLDDAVPLEAKKVNGDHSSKDTLNKEDYIFEEQEGANENDTKSSTDFVDTVNDAGNSMEVEPRDVNCIEMKCNSEMIVCGKTLEAKKADGNDCMPESGKEKKRGTGAKESDCPAACLGNLTLHGKISGENESENQLTMSAEQDAGVGNKKKRGSLTKERREKKKQRKRIKRAEMNRKLGVKRLKLQPVSKPKTVTYCRHYLKGRCHEADKCKFSHDTIPLTKSKPCCHFARHMCMKGEDCPFDHQLSKYPCNNYVSNGYCSRGADCMFSHEMPLKEGFPVASNVSKPELKSVCLPANINPKKQLNIHGTSLQNVNANSCSIEVSPRNKNEQTVAQTVKHALQASKGVNSLLFGKSSVGDTNKYYQTGSSAKVEDGFKVGSQTIQTVSHRVGNSNEITKSTARLAPKGINFLSFGKTLSDDSGSNKSASLPSDGDNGIGKSLLGNFSKDKQAGSYSNLGDAVKEGNQNRQNASDVVQHFKEMPKRTPTGASMGTNFLSFGKAPSENFSNNKQSSLCFNGNYGVSSSVQERRNASDKLQFSSTMPWRLSSSSLPSGQSLDGLADVHGRDAQSSAQKALISNTSSSAKKAIMSNTPNSAKKALLSNTPNSAQKSFLSNTPSSTQRALLSTLAFAAKFESGIKMQHPLDALSVKTDLSMETGCPQSK
ncbi:zinc finger CCCH domain-containing protein 65 [Cornus florida]|uniref:zinc finger CCCH domain-containing protein 65 n=1 Tax=Cornus florida TaxID=4283 RepID=UPI00289729C5|nr:zinc finger CCCH domain-containing protein 65 [Cornus florida]